jgi:hypothetical protein
MFDLDPAQLTVEFGMQYVTVTGADEISVSIRTAAATRLGGRYVIEGDAPEVDHASFAVGTVPADPDLATTISLSASTVHDGRQAFEFRALSGPLRFELRRAPPGWYLKSAIVNGLDATDHPVIFGPGGVREGELEVVVARGGRIAGRATDPRGGQVRDYAVVVFSTDASQWYFRSRLLKQVRADGDGAFSVPGLPPGEYWVAAVDWVPGGDDGEWQTPVVLGALVPGAQRVRVGELDDVSVTLRLTRMP